MHQLRIVVNQCEGALLRTLGTIERRGYFTLGLHTENGPFPSTWTVAVTVQERPGIGRSAAVLARHLEKLYDVQSVQIESANVPIAVERPASC